MWRNVCASACCRWRHLTYLLDRVHWLAHIIPSENYIYLNSELVCFFSLARFTAIASWAIASMLSYLLLTLNSHFKFIIVNFRCFRNILCLFGYFSTLCRRRSLFLWGHDWFIAWCRCAIVPLRLYKFWYSDRIILFFGPKKKTTCVKKTNIEKWMKNSNAVQFKWHKAYAYSLVVIFTNQIGWYRLKKPKSQPNAAVIKIKPFQKPNKDFYQMICDLSYLNYHSISSFFTINRDNLLIIELFMTIYHF